MPFQVIYSEFSRQPGVINSFNAGEDQIVVCDPTITLTATVNGDLFGHTILWEQVSGAPVNFVTPTDQLIVSYENGSGSPLTGGTFDDKVFRFWIDKGSTDPNNPPMFDDVNIFGAPTEQLYNDISTTLVGLGQGHKDSNVPTNVLVILEDDGAECSATAFDLIWDPPPNEEVPVVRYQIEEYAAGVGFATIGFVKPTVRRFNNIVVGRSYRILTVLANGSKGISKLVWADPTQNRFAQSSSFTSIAANDGATISNFELNLVTLVPCVDPQLDNNNTYNDITTLSGGVISNFDVIERSLTQCIDPQLDNNNSYNDISTKPAVITDFTVIDLTGGQVGG